MKNSEVTIRGYVNGKPWGEEKERQYYIPHASFSMSVRWWVAVFLSGLILWAALICAALGVV